MPALSVVVPTLDEERSIGALLTDLRALDVPYEVIVVDGGSSDRTVAVAERHGARVLRAPRGRGGQLAAGGYPNVPLMEDVALIDALRRITTVRALWSPLVVSARRWERDGPLVRMLRNWTLMVAYRAGASPARLAEWYDPRGRARLPDAARGTSG